jgi:hypothetical protein
MLVVQIARSLAAVTELSIHPLVKLASLTVIFIPTLLILAQPLANYSVVTGFVKPQKEKSAMLELRIPIHQLPHVALTARILAVEMESLIKMSNVIPRVQPQPAMLIAHTDVVTE